MIKDNRIIKFINKPIPAGIVSTAIFTFVQGLFKKRFFLTMNLSVFYDILKTGILSIIGSYVIYTYYNQQKEIKEIENIKDSYKDLKKEKIELKKENNLNMANIFYIIAQEKNNSYCQFKYLILSLDRYIGTNDKMVRQILNEFPTIIKNIDKKYIQPEDISMLREVLNNVEKEKFNAEIEQINEIIKTNT